MFNLRNMGCGARPVGDALKWLGMRFDGPPVEPSTRTVLWLIAWMAFMWFLPNTQQCCALASRL